MTDKRDGNRFSTDRRSAFGFFPRPSRVVIGILLMVLSGLNFVAVTAIVKHVGDQVPPAQAAFLRYLLGLVFILPMLRPIFEIGIKRKDMLLFGLRGAVHTVGVLCWFYAMTQITIAEVTAMNYLVPVYITIGAAIFLGEGIALRRILAVCAALVGALIILRPGIREVVSGHYAMIFTALSFAGSYLLAKRLTDSTNVAVVVRMLSIFVTIGLAPFAIAVWVTPTIAELAWLFLVAFFATAGHYLMTMSFRYAPISAVQPATFLQLVWAALLGALVFGEPTDIWVIAGGVVIIGAASYVTLREAKISRGRSRSSAS